MDRRRFLESAIGVIGVAGTQRTSARGINPQTPGVAIQRPDRYDDSLIVDRKPFSWPGGKTLAVWIVPNVEVWSYDSTAGVAISPSESTQAPDVINYAWREYGMRVGLWRIADVLDSLGVSATVALNSAVCEVVPRAVELMKARGWEFMGHGITNSKSLRGLSRADEQQVIRKSLQTIERATGQRPRGWLGPGLGETFNTLDLLAEAGVVYTGDWNNDDQPCRMKVAAGEMFALPYCMQINDIGFFLRRGHSGQEYYRALVDHFDTLYADSQRLPRVLGIPLHPFLIGQPLYINHFRRAMQHIQQHERVWFATGSEIVAAHAKV
jgi:peptidoglycan/xylan/chitin deacetylase (PgdA/CDA1 family)